MPNNHPDTIVPYFHRNDSLFVFEENNPDSLKFAMLQVADSIPSSSFVLPDTLDNTHDINRREH